MAIISVSLDEEIIEEAARIQKRMGFSGRSELIRSALRAFITQAERSEKMRGEIDAVLTVIHTEHGGTEVSSIAHSYERIIRTHLHNHLKDGKCLEIFILKGDARAARGLYEALTASRKVELCELAPF